MLKITRDELPMEQGVYGGCPLCPLYSLLAKVNSIKPWNSDSLILYELQTIYANGIKNADRIKRS